MDRYTLLCTEEQTKKALELGAPIEQTPMLDILRNEIGERCFLSGTSLYWFPTAEQMLAWLEEQNIVINISNFHNEYGYSVSKFENNFDESIAYLSAIGSNNSRKEATLAAINGALDYLTNQKTK